MSPEGLELVERILRRDGSVREALEHRKWLGDVSKETGMSAEKEMTRFGQQVSAGRRGCYGIGVVSLKDGRAGTAGEEFTYLEAVIRRAGIMLASGPSRGLGRLEYEEKSIYWFWNPVDSITWERQPMLEGKARSYIRPDSEPTCTTNLQVTRNILTMGNSSLYRMLHEVQALGAKSETLFGISRTR
uniref:Uncharacterized protein n=1 Tax=Moniliophthora roreri TaxID=221103 RepID=A0A0W0G8A8_MONRR